LQQFGCTPEPLRERFKDIWSSFIKIFDNVWMDLPAVFLSLDEKGVHTFKGHRE